MDIDGIASFQNILALLVVVTLIGPMIASASDDQGQALVVDPDGATIYVTGSSQGPDSGWDFATLWLEDEDGLGPYQPRHDGGINGTDLAKAVVYSDLGPWIVVAGESEVASGEMDAALVVYWSNNATVYWNTTFQGVTGGDDKVYAAEVSPDGRYVYITGSTWNGASTRKDYAVMAYDLQEKTLSWNITIAGFGVSTDEATAIGVGDNGTMLFVTGTQNVFQQGYNFLTLAIWAETGSLAWSSSYDGTAHIDDSANAIAIDPNRATVYVTGRSRRTGADENYTTLAYNISTGNLIRGAYQDGGANLGDISRAITVSSDGWSVYVTGDGRSTSSYDYLTIAYNDTLQNKSWQRQYHHLLNGNDFASALVLSPDDSTLFVTGKSSSDGVANSANSHYATVAYNGSTGADTWSSARRYNGLVNGPNAPKAIAVSPNGAKIYVTGESTGIATGLDYATVSYSASGDNRWASRYDNTNGDDRIFLQTVWE